MSLSEIEATTESEQVEQAAGNLRKEAWKRLRRDPVALVGFALIAFFILVAILAPLIAPYAPDAQPGRGMITPTNFAGPSADHWFGLDASGRDEFSRVVYGARQSLLVGVVATLFGMLGGLILGTLAGAFGGKVDAVVMRIVDVMLSIPGLLMAIAIAALLGASFWSVMIAIAIINVPVFARLLRGQMLAQRGSDYVLAAVSIGVRRRPIVFGHILPNSISPVIVQATLTLATAIIEAAGLSFLGLGSADPRVPEWGRMLADTQRYLASAPHLAFFPGIAIVIAALGFTMLGERLREAIDPKYRR